MAAVDACFTASCIHVVNIDFHMETQEDKPLFTNLYTLELPSGMTYPEVIRRLMELPDITSIHTLNN